MAGSDTPSRSMRVAAEYRSTRRSKNSHNPIASNALGSVPRSSNKSIIGRRYLLSVVSILPRCVRIHSLNCNRSARRGLRRSRWPLPLHQLAKTGQDKFAVLFNLFVGERAERIEKCSSGSFVLLGGFGKCQ
jgi:hypothetical protein